MQEASLPLSLPSQANELAWPHVEVQTTLQPSLMANQAPSGPFHTGFSFGQMSAAMTAPLLLPVNADGATNSDQSIGTPRLSLCPMEKKSGAHPGNIGDSKQPLLRRHAIICIDSNL